MINLQCFKASNAARDCSALVVCHGKLCKHHSLDAFLKGYMDSVCFLLRLFCRSWGGRALVQLSHIHEKLVLAIIDGAFALR